MRMDEADIEAHQTVLVAAALHPWSVQRGPEQHWPRLQAQLRGPGQACCRPPPAPMAPLMQAKRTAQLNTLLQKHLADGHEGTGKYCAAGLVLLIMLFGEVEEVQGLRERALFRRVCSKPSVSPLPVASMRKSRPSKSFECSRQYINLP